MRSPEVRVRVRVTVGVGVGVGVGVRVRVGVRVTEVTLPLVGSLNGIVSSGASAKGESSST